eukprot:5955860-Pleurochrysis_carterae.AAC.1
MRPASPGFAQDNGQVVLHIHSKCDQQNMRRFLFGVIPEPKVVVKTAEKSVPTIVPCGKGNAIVIVASGAVIEFTNALLVPNLGVNLASVEQAMVQNKVEVRFGNQLDIVLHKHGKFIPLNVGYGLLHVRPLNPAELEDICKKHHGVTPDVITRGKAATGPSPGTLSVADTAWLWGARLP